MPSMLTITRRFPETSPRWSDGPRRPHGNLTFTAGHVPRPKLEDNPMSNGPETQLQNLTPDEARALIREAVRETFLMLGVTVDDPIEVQKDFQHLREWRNTTNSLKSKGLLTAIGIVTSGFLAAVWLGLKEILNK